MELEVTRGTLLVAPVALTDPNFRQTVVLICDHGPPGTYGLILNRRLPAGAELNKALPFNLEHVFSGGPVQMDALQVLHPYGAQVPGCLEVMPGLWLGGDFDVLARQLKQGRANVAKCRFFLGYSGWEAGQLDRELEQDAWMVSEPCPRILEGESVDEMWARAVREYGKHVPLYSNYPLDPAMN